MVFGHLVSLYCPTKLEYTKIFIKIMALNIMSLSLTILLTLFCIYCRIFSLIGDFTMATIEKRIHKNGETSYRVRIRMYGYPAQTATFDKFTLAKEWAAKTETEMKEGKYFNRRKAQKYTVSEIIDKYKKSLKAQGKYESTDLTAHFRWWKEHIGQYSLADVTPALISEMKDLLLVEKNERGQSRSPSTVNRYLTTMQGVFSVAVKEWELLDINPFFRVKKLKEPQGRIRFLENDERTRLLEECKKAANPYLYPAVIVALSTGARKMEVLGLKWEDVDLANERAILKDTKNGERRSINLLGEVNNIIAKLYNERKPNAIYVFPSNDGTKPFDIMRSWRAAIKRAGIENFRFHDLRHTTASYLAMQGKSLGEIADVLGHKTLQMVKRYAHLSDAHKKSLTADMNKTIFGE